MFDDSLNDYFNVRQLSLVKIGKLSANLHNKLHNINKLNKYTNFKTRLSFINGYIIGKLQYMLPLYMNANQINVNKLHKVLMRAARMPGYQINVIGSQLIK